MKVENEEFSARFALKMPRKRLRLSGKTTASLRQGGVLSGRIALVVVMWRHAAER